MRVIAGRAKGRKLVVAKTANTRPTPDKVREALFSIVGDTIVGAQVLDVCAGTGAIGIEALSRGACHATFIEPHAQALVALRRNVGLFAEKSTLLAMPFASAFKKLGQSRKTFDFVFVDPPWSLDAGHAVLHGLIGHALVDQGGLVVVEFAARHKAPQLAEGFVQNDCRTFGDVGLAFFVRAQTVLVAPAQRESAST